MTENVSAHCVEPLNPRPSLSQAAAQLSAECSEEKGRSVSTLLPFFMSTFELRPFC